MVTGEFHPLTELPTPRRLHELTNEAQYYKSFKKRQQETESSSIVSLSFCPEEPYNLAVVSGTRIRIWQKGKDGKMECQNTISKFKDVVQCVSWRSDGKLILAGDATGTTMVIETETRQVLKRLRGPSDAVTCVSFASSDRTRCATGGRDGKLRLWDVATAELLLTVEAHSDCIKVLSPGAGSADAWITAGRDGHVRVWDLQTSDGKESSNAAKIVDVDHGSPIDAGAVFPGGGMYVSAGGTSLKLWDLVSGGKEVQCLQQAHSKAITGLSLDSKASVLLTVSFDGLAKVFQAASLKQLWSFQLSGPGSCIAWRPDNLALVIGLEDQTWRFMPRRTAVDAAADVAAKNKEKEQSKKKRPRATEGLEAGEGDEVIQTKRPRSEKERKVDFLLRKFEYQKVIEFVLQKSKEPKTALPIFEELLNRGALQKTLTEVGEENCLGLLRILSKTLGSFRDRFYMQLSLETLHTLFDCNKCLQPPKTKVLSDVVQNVSSHVVKLLKEHEDLMETCGMLRLVANL